MPESTDLRGRMEAARLDDDDDRLEAMVRSRLFGPAHAPPARIGRFTLLERIGRGGMGDVYAAYDPVLDRKVALKILRPGAAERQGADARRALVDEARAAARLAHPSVVAIHEVGEVDEVGGEGCVYVAMELIDGLTLRAWLRAPRPALAILRVFVDAGLALAAAHDAGIIHRDFKPENLLISGEGAELRGRVVDFGLARLAAPPSLAGDAAAAPLSTIAGTPAYMSPEQLRGLPLDGRSDLFAYCVALHQALTGRHPFGADHEGMTTNDLLAMIESEAPRAGDRDLPAWLRPILRRGLRADPRARPPSMRALLRDLQVTPARRRRRRLVLGAAALALGSSALTVAGVDGLGRSTCSESQIELVGAWDPEVRAAAASAFAAAGLPGADEVWARVEPRLDDYARAWAASRAQTCAGRLGAADLPADLRHLRERCLDRRRAELAGLTGRLTRADADALRAAIAAAASLTPIAACDDLEALRRERGAGSSAAARALRRAVLRRTAAARAGGAAELVADADALLAALTPLAAPAALAEAHLLRALVDEAAGDYDGAAARLEVAIREAIAGRHDRLHAELAVRLVWAHGVRRRDRAAARAWEGHAAAAIRAIGGDPALTARLLDHRGAIAGLAGDPVEAARLHRESIALRERIAPLADDELAASLGNLGLALLSQGAVAEATPAIEASLARFRATHGPSHPDVAAMLTNLGLAALDAGDPARARALLTDALALKERIAGPDHPSLLPPLTGLGNAEGALGRGAAALAHYRRGLAIGERAFGPESPLLAELLHNLAFESWLLGDHAAVIRDATRALAAQRGGAAADDPRLALTLELLARGHLGAGDVDAAAAAIDEALALAERGPLRPIERGGVLLTAAMIRRAQGAGAAELRPLAAAARELLGDPPDPLAAAELDALLTP